MSKYNSPVAVKKVKKRSMRRSLLPQEMPTDDHLNVLKKAFQCYCEGNVVSWDLPIGYSVIVALTGLPIGYSVTVALGLPIQCNSSSNRSPYRIQCNSSSNRSPYRIQCNSSSNW